MVKKKYSKKYGKKLFDMNSTANLPQNVITMFYRSDMDGMYPAYDDSSAYIEKQTDGDRRMAIKSKPKSRY
jgi:hypothetical protein